MKRLTILIGVFLFILTLSSNTLAQDKTLVVAIMSTVLSLDPANYRDRVTETVLRNMFDGLVTRTRTGRSSPRLRNHGKTRVRPSGNSKSEEASPSTTGTR